MWVVIEDDDLVREKKYRRLSTVETRQQILCQHSLKPMNSILICVCGEIGQLTVH